MRREPWYESDNPGRLARGAGWRIAVWVVCAVAFFGLLGAGVWAVKVATSGVKGAGDQTRQVNDGTNRIAAQEQFHALYNQVLAYDQQLDQAAADKRENPGDKTFAQNYSGLVKVCLDARNQYNADANKVTKAKWRDPALPYQLDGTDPSTDCRESK